MPGLSRVIRVVWGVTLFQSGLLIVLYMAEEVVNLRVLAYLSLL